ncbi:TrkH family potassium uptake protein [Papillibacter cinnamivorans]|uniref:Trk system potassium uptake protein TrkH n=1 Tax=Papillibacter cinnamivorans DSM 12816 TaxID=1122930 RepID=A0A1W1ZEJ6_9FIRM|nr:TrkH family potassium uptake protein [Papillibacter cinnamivorans]SMC46817.1 trk system potassium uptake protein TrkH [Papillibacter cinnamivorans DSM 12816]
MKLTLGRRFFLHLTMTLHQKKGQNTTRLIVLGFLGIILAGALLLMLPISAKSGETTNFLTALFTATSATCVTGLVVVDTDTYWTVFGQTVILLLIQIGGLGFMSIVSLFFFAMRRQIGLRQRLAMAQSLSLNELTGVVRIMKHILVGTFLFELIGAVIFSICFVPDFGLGGGIWRGVFHSISAFCNAGFDLMGSRGAYTGFIWYSGNPAVCITAMCLIVIGGLGFFVWEDVYRARKLRNLHVYTKLVLVTTAVLILAGALCIFLLESDNSATMADMPVWQKIMASFFQSITSRTAGFNTIDENGMAEASKIVTMILMFIGGSSGSTAGGIKTVTMCVLLLTVISTLKGKGQITVFERTISPSKALSAITIAFLALSLCLVGALFLSTGENVSFTKAIFESVSAFCTVGLTTGITPTLGAVSRIVLIGLMYLGRVGVTTFGIALMMRTSYPAKIKYPQCDVLIG